MPSLIPAKPALPIGVSPHFRAAAFFHPVTSPNKHRTNIERGKDNLTILKKQLV
jgi:hypothetical protein